MDLIGQAVEAAVGVNVGFVAVDFDGFLISGEKGSLRFLPREIGVTIGTKTQLIEATSIYLFGGITRNEISRNRRRITYVQKNVNGLPLWANKPARRINEVMLSKSTTLEWTNVLRSFLKFLIDKFKSRFGEDSRVFLIHKGKLEEKYLRRMSKAIGAEDSVFDLENFGCPSVAKIMRSGAYNSRVLACVSCDETIHKHLVKKSEWPHHCPQCETICLTYWIQEHIDLRIIPPSNRLLLSRSPTISKDMLKRVFKKALDLPNAPKSYTEEKKAKFVNFIMRYIYAQGEFVPIPMLETSLSDYFEDKLPARRAQTSL